MSSTEKCFSFYATFLNYIWCVYKYIPKLLRYWHKKSIAYPKILHLYKVHKLLLRKEIILFQWFYSLSFKLLPEGISKVSSDPALRQEFVKLFQTVGNPFTLLYFCFLRHGETPLNIFHPATVRVFESNKQITLQQLLLKAEHKFLSPFLTEQRYLVFIFVTILQRV